ncbi:L,D-transpeptidase family protein [uncultured Sphingomonas sp.]|uniref:L,D-transpeptidase family protein n=1 Tax=uncultured Sphingomonas sp. TaxID=158754 RepID=UPI0025990B24|nr:L,D-transpeptidase family protein [uncultured Sphingomonas sp.]
MHLPRALAAKLILGGSGIAVLAAASVSRLPPRPVAVAAPTPRAAIMRSARAAAPAASLKRGPAAESTATAMTIKRVLPIGAIKFGDYAWDTKGVPDGPLIITVDLAAQTLSVFRDGYEIGAAAILYGADDKPTPLGTFPITQKDAHHVSNLYDAPMPYMLRLTNDGVSIHGTEVAWGYATHGCIGVPTKFARLLFNEARLGDRVIITRGKSLLPAA